MMYSFERAHDAFGARDVDRGHAEGRPEPALELLLRHPPRHLFERRDAGRDDLVGEGALGDLAGQLARLAEGHDLARDAPRAEVRDQLLRALEAGPTQGGAEDTPAAPPSRDVRQPVGGTDGVGRC